MGLIKAFATSLRSGMGDQWLDFIYCDALPADVLLRKGQKQNQTTHFKSSNTKGSENVITKGSKIAVNEGQFMVIVDQGKVIDFTDEPGEYTFDASTEPSMFYGSFGKGLIESFKQVGKRFAFGGDTAHDQRVYFINKKDIIGNKFGTPNPVPFRDSEFGFTVDIKCFGEYVYKIIDPLLFFATLCGNVEDEFYRSEIDSQFKTDLLSALQPALANVAMKRISYDMLPGAVLEISNAVRDQLAQSWGSVNGINVTKVSIASVTTTDESAKKIKEFQSSRVYSDRAMQSGRMTEAFANAVEGIGQNSGNSTNAMFGMMGVGMMNNMGANMFGGVGAQQMQQGQQAPQQPAQQGAQQALPQANPNSWTCKCGAVNTGKFCTECASPKPAPVNTWRCDCGEDNTGKFCKECGKPNTTGRLYKCDKCGWTPEDPTKPPKFCPECGDTFDMNDIQK
ncbi:MAG: SPFH domain-containing protein [Clostridia bacterium]|nr:SPFH domain-containing protein [Clostridia bacterium]